MKKLAALAVCALAFAAPAAADPGSTALYPETIPGAGLGGVAGAQHTVVRLAIGRGTVGASAFTLTTSRVTYASGTLRFRSLGIRTVVFGQNAVRLTGTGLVDGRRVSFTAVGVHNALPGVDVFRLGWSHGATHGGRVTSGALFIR